jgi:hypothetical protein
LTVAADRPAKGDWERFMEGHEPFSARSVDVLIEGNTVVLSFLTALDGDHNVSVSMKVDVLERLHERIGRALRERSEQS